MCHLSTKGLNILVFFFVSVGICDNALEKRLKVQRLSFFEILMGFIGF